MTGDTAGRRVCQACGSRAVVPVVYGAPNALLAPLFASGQIEAGGAIGRLADHSGAHWLCRGCGASWRGGMFDAGSGNSPSDPVLIGGIAEHPVRIRAEQMYLVERFGLPADLAADGKGWQMAAQAAARSGDRMLDMLTIELPDGTSRVVYFELAGPAQPRATRTPRRPLPWWRRRPRG